MLKAVLFDFDGVVVQSENAHMETFQELVAPYGIKITKKQWFEEFTGTGSRGILTTILVRKKLFGKLDFEELLEKRRKMYLKKVREGKVILTKGVLEFLERLEGMGVERAIVSGGHPSHIQGVLAKLGIRKRFSVVISCTEFNAPKPDHRAYLEAVKRLNVKREECLIIEDSVAGCEAAKRAKIRLAVIRSPTSRDLYGFDIIVKDFTEFPLERFYD
ncbi:HAD family phosphatase [Candidatus Micrarchaeota archaeon]|nr:HAD family phosphatase [Candidatus Micrarchaeota archaeon]